jgi:hypothetical protein
VLWRAPAVQRCHRFAETTALAVADPAAAVEHIAAAAIGALTRSVAA